jgi:magnesium-transporting ATPase (P-type)
MTREQAQEYGPPANGAQRWWQLSAAQAMEVLASRDAGLSDEEAQERLRRYGPNELPEERGTSLAGVVLRQFTSPLIYILIVAAVAAALLGEFIDSAIIAAVLLFNALIGTFQEYRAERSMEALRKVASARAHTMRNGREHDLDARELVPGDIVIVEAGAKVPADCRILYAAALEADESLLTGESTTVEKHAEVIEAAEPGAGERANMLVMGSIVTRGRGRGLVVATGAATLLGQIAGSVRETGKAEAPILARMKRFAQYIALIVLVSSAVSFSLGLALGYDPDDLFLTLVALMVASIPEGLPIVMTVTLAIGVSRMARRNVIIRRLPAVETLGSTTVIGSDKTGTLTQNRMTVGRISAGGRDYRVSGGGYSLEGEIALDGQPASIEDDEALRLILLAGVLNNEAYIEEAEGNEDDEFEVQGDPTEIALLVAAAKAGIWKEPASEEYPRWAEVPFNPEERYAATFTHHGDKELTFVKGAPEEVLAMCDRALGEEGLDRERVLEVAQEMAGDGLRVLGFAFREEERRERPAGHIPDHRGGLTFLGLQAMIDPPRDEVKRAIQGCQEAGIRVLMITGDHAVTGLAIARELGIANEDDTAITGADLDGMDDEQLSEVVTKVPVYARVSPQHKLRVVLALQDRDEVVAVTGDGVNDGPALKAANIGVAMGRSGTDVAKEASDMVITDDNFVSIFAAVEEGRIVFDNVRKVTFFLIATGAAVILAVLASIVFDFDLPFLPAQLLWLNLVTNGVQDVFLAFEPGEKDVLKRKPRPHNEGIISPLLWERTAISGVVMAIGTVLLFLHEIDSGASLEEARTVALTTMVLFQVFHIGNSRSEHRSAFARSPLLNPLLLMGTAIALLVHAGSLHWGPTQNILRVEPLSLETWLTMALVASSIVVVNEVHKLIRGPRGADRYK